MSEPITFAQLCRYEAEFLDQQACLLDPSTAFPHTVLAYQQRAADFRALADILDHIADADTAALMLARTALTSPIQETT